MNLKEFNALPKTDAANALFLCCGSVSWLKHVMKKFPFTSCEALVSVATTTWYEKCQPADWLESFSHHPKIGDLKNLTKKFATTAVMAGAEQQNVSKASDATIKTLAVANKAYEKKYGFIFIVCATGKSAEEMVRLIQLRKDNSKAEELKIAMGEQHKITILRLKKLMQQADWSFVKGSQITTHVLNTTLGKPGIEISIALKQLSHKSWNTIAQGITNSDGRIMDLLPPEKRLPQGNYKLVFDTGTYFKKFKINGFYPEIEIQFTVTTDQHYHVPLLLNPFGYSTYRGS